MSLMQRFLILINFFGDLQMSPDMFVTKIVQMNPKKLISFLMDQDFLQREQKCETCKNTMVLSKSQQHREAYVWRCKNKNAKKLTAK